MVLVRLVSLVGLVGSWGWSVACLGLVNWHEDFHKSLSVFRFPYWIWSIILDTIAMYVRAIAMMVRIRKYFFVEEKVWKRLVHV